MNAITVLEDLETHILVHIFEGTTSPLTAQLWIFFINIIFVCVSFDDFAVGIPFNNNNKEKNCNFFY